MEEDDEFGDLYTMSSASIQTPAPTFSRPINERDDEKIIFQVLNSKKKVPGFYPKDSDSHRDLKELNKNENLVGGRIKLDKSPARVLGSVDEVKQSDSQKRGFDDPKFVDEYDMNVIVEEGDEKDEILAGRSDNFDLGDVNTGMGDSLIPGLSIPGVSGSANNGKDVYSGEADEWDSDSEDDLQIVLNDNNHQSWPDDHGPRWSGWA